MSVYEVVRMTTSNSVRGLETSLEVFPDTLVSFAHPGQTQNGVFGIPDQVPYYDLVRDFVHKKKHMIWLIKKKTLLYNVPRNINYEFIFCTDEFFYVQISGDSGTSYRQEVTFVTQPLFSYSESQATWAVT